MEDGKTPDPFSRTLSPSPEPQLWQLGEFLPSATVTDDTVRCGLSNQVSVASKVAPRRLVLAWMRCGCNHCNQKFVQESPPEHLTSNGTDQHFVKHVQQLVARQARLPSISCFRCK